jgi:hypothetical protein
METVERLVRDCINGIDHGDYLAGLIDDLDKGKTNPQTAARQLVSRLASDLSRQLMKEE